MRPFGVEFRVGIFILLASAAIIVIFFFLNPDSFRGGDYKTYYTVTDNAEGIVEKTHVRTNGVTVGRVAKIILLTNRTKIMLEIQADVDVPIESVVEIRSRGLLGDKYVEIVRSPLTEMAADGAELASSSDSLSAEEVVAYMGRIAKDIKKITQSLAGSLATEQGQDTIKKIFEDMSGLLADLRSVVKENRGEVAATVSHLQRAAAGVERVVASSGDNLEQILVNLEEVSTSLKTVLGEEGRQKFNSILTKFDDSMADIRETAGNIKLVSTNLQEGKGTLGKLLSDDETINKIEQTLDSVSEVLSPASKLQVEVDYHSEMRTNNSSQHYFNLLFRTRQDKYYLFGVTDLGERVTVTRKDTTPQQDGSEHVSYQKETITDDKALRFNVQFARRWYDVALRFGLFESKGGLASDLYLLDDRLRLTLEAFDWNSEGSEVRKVAHFKAYAKLVFLRHLTLVAGIDDPTRLAKGSNSLRNNLNYFFGAGFSFTDNDLKGFLGTAALAF